MLLLLLLPMKIVKTNATNTQRYDYYLILFDFFAAGFVCSLTIMSNILNYKAERKMNATKKKN